MKIILTITTAILAMGIGYTQTLIINHNEQSKPIQIGTQNPIENIELTNLKADVKSVKIRPGSVLRKGTEISVTGGIAKKALTNKNGRVIKYVVIKYYSGADCKGSTKIFRRKILINNTSSSDLKPNSATNQSPKYTILYDGENQTIDLKKIKRNGYIITKKKLRPSVGSLIRLEAVNIPDGDSVGVTYNFEDRNVEDSEKFQSIINAGTDKTKTDATSSVTKAKIEISKWQISQSELFTDPADKTITDTKKQSCIYNAIKEMNIYKLTEDDLKSEQCNLSDNEKSVVSALETNIIAACNRYIVEAIDKYKNEWEQYYNKSQSYESLKSNLRRINKEYFNQEEIDRVYFTSTLLKDDVIKPELDKLFTFFNRSPSYQTSKSSIIQVKNMDILNLEIKHLSKKKEVFKFNGELLNKGGVKIDFSTGFFLNGLKDDKYVLKKDTAGHQDTLIKLNTGNYNIGLGVMSHLYFRTGTRVNVGLTTGFLTDVETNIRYVLGASLMLGMERRWVLTGGVIAGKRKVLSEPYKENGTINTKTSDVIPYVDRFDYSWFFGISYNFGGINLTK